MTRTLKDTRVLVAVMMIAGAVIAAGCMKPAPSTGVSQSRSKPFDSKEPAEGPLEPNIVRVNKFFSSEPWLSFESDGTNRPDGVKFSVYLEGPRKSAGVFGTGRMVVTMYRIDINPVGEEMATQVYEWDLPADKCYVYRAKAQTALGWGYGLRLQWDRGLDLSGKQVAFLVKYIREDGKVITSSRQVLKLPKNGSVGIEPYRSLTATVKPATGALSNDNRTSRARAPRQKPASVTAAPATTGK
ncbi:MAG: hypothetical protein HZA51_18110 [Planctomycetes bacterium]|nr:hypothetical protein [Planctomycetota bacterium]